MLDIKKFTDNLIAEVAANRKVTVKEASVTTVTSNKEAAITSNKGVTSEIPSSLRKMAAELRTFKTTISYDDVKTYIKEMS